MGPRWLTSADGVVPALLTEWRRCWQPGRQEQPRRRHRRTLRRRRRMTMIPLPTRRRRRCCRLGRSRRPGAAGLVVRARSVVGRGERVSGRVGIGAGGGDGARARRGGRGERIGGSVVTGRRRRRTTWRGPGERIGKRISRRRGRSLLPVGSPNGLMPCWPNGLMPCWPIGFIPDMPELPAPSSDPRMSISMVPPPMPPIVSLAAAVIVVAAAIPSAWVPACSPRPLRRCQRSCRGTSR